MNKAIFYYADISTLLFELEEAILNVITLDKKFGSLSDVMCLEACVENFVAKAVSLNEDLETAEIYNDLYGLCQSHDDFYLIDEVMDEFAKQVSELHADSIEEIRKKQRQRNVSTFVFCHSNTLILGMSYEPKRYRA